MHELRNGQLFEAKRATLHFLRPGKSSNRLGNLQEISFVGAISTIPKEKAFLYEGFSLLSQTQNGI